MASTSLDSRVRWPGKLLCTAGGLAGLLAAATGVYATRVEPYRPRLRLRSMRVPANWPAVEVLHLSDLHLRRSDSRLSRALIAAVQRLERQPDLVCITGDLCERVEDAGLVAQLVGQLSPRLGVFVSLGNHEYNAAPPDLLRRGQLLSRLFHVGFGHTVSRGSHEADAIVDALRGAGVTVLRNQGTCLEVGRRSLWLGATDSAWAHRADPRAALAGRCLTEGALVMVHEPEVALEAFALGADLVLAGHTHGGQVRVPFVRMPYSHRVDPRITISAGVQELGGGLLHISAGAGQLVPLRLFCPPELVWIRCVPSQSTQVG